MKGLWKTTIVIWSDFDPQNMELEDLAHQATSGESECSLQEDEWVEDPVGDPHPPSVEFFNLEDEGDE